MPLRNEADHIGRALDSILGQTYPLEQIELFLIDGCSTDSTWDKLEEFERQHGDRFMAVRLLRNEKRSAPSGLNLSIEHATCELWLRLDGHSEISANYVEAVVRGLTDLDEAVCVSGQLVTIGFSRRGRAIARAQSSRWGSGGGNFRLDHDRETEVTTTAFGVSRLSDVLAVGVFDEALIRNQDDEFNSRLSQIGKLWVVPSASATYYCREKYWPLAKQYFQYGLYKPDVLRRPGYPSAARHYAAPVLVLVHLLSLMWVGKRPLLAVASLVSHLTLVGAAAWRDLRRPGDAVVAAIAAVDMQISYGFGFLVGLLRWRRTARRSEGTTSETESSRDQLGKSDESRLGRRGEL